LVLFINGRLGFGYWANKRSRFDDVVTLEWVLESISCLEVVSIVFEVVIEFVALLTNSCVLQSFFDVDV
jgi:hypothetical protein